MSASTRDRKSRNVLGIDALTPGRIGDTGTRSLIVVDDVMTSQMRIWIQEYLDSPLADDPLTRLVQLDRAEAAYHRECNNETFAKALEISADRLEKVLGLIRSERVDYQLAAVLADVVNGTVRNKVSDGEWQGGNGRVVLGSITIAPTRAPDTHGVIALDRIREWKDRGRQESSDARSAQAERSKRVEQARAKRRREG